MATSASDVKCTLLFSSGGRGERVVLRSEAPPEAEYALFEIGDIELRASEPGRVREHGYQTTAGKARARLANVGMSGAVAREVALAMQPVLADAYARGAAAKRVARYLGPFELFQADGYDPTTHLYHGVFLDLAALARDLEIDHASTTLHALYLATLLENEDDETEVIISTDACTKGGKPGTRTYKRPSFTEIQRLMNALGGLAHRSPTPDIAELMPKAAVIEFLRSRAAAAPDDDARDLYKSLEAAVAVRDMPDKGPLSLPDLWAIEQRIEANQFEGTLDAIDEAERRHGRTPGTTYLRARISLELRLEPPKLIAERISALALSMTSFSEIALLAAESWLEAGDPRRAMPYARDLVDSPHLEEGIRLRAQSLLQRAGTNKPRRRMSPTLVDAVRPAPLATRTDNEPTPVPQRVPAPPSTPTPKPDAAPEAAFTQGLGIEDLVLEPETPPPPQARSLPPPVPSSRSLRAAPMMPTSSRRMPAAAPATMPPPESAPGPQAARKPMQSTPTQDEIAIPDIPLTEPSIPEDRPSSFPALRAQRPAAAEHPVSMPPPLELDLSPADPAASFTLDLPSPDAVPEPAPMSSPTPSRRPRMSGMVTETRPPTSYDPRAEPDSPVIPRSASVPEIRSAPPPREKMRSSPAPARRSVQPAEPVPFDDRGAIEDPFGGASFGASDPDPADLDEPTPPRLDAPSLGLAHFAPGLDDHTEPSLPPSSASGALPPLVPRVPRAPSAVPAPLSLPPLPSAPPQAPLPVPSEPSALPVPVPAPAADKVGHPTLREEEPTSFMRGASMPPFRLESPAPLLPKSPLFSKVAGDELAEHLALPPGIGGEARSLDVLPTSVLEARIQFTLLSRELGLDYRLKRGIELRADVDGIEQMQAVLAEMFPDRVVRTRDEAFEVRRHGAFLTEILARRLDAEWLDISPEELGHWVMIVPPDTRVWPFGRVARLIAMGHKERDLVSYFFELTSRFRAR